MESLRNEEKVRALQEKLSRKAKAEPRFRFYALYDKTYRMDFLRESYRRVKANGGSPGIDGQTFEMVESQGLESYLQTLQEEMKAGKYRPQPVLRVYIPKPNGEQRPLGIPTIRDRIVQGAFKLVLEPIFESDFSEQSFGFRPGKSAHDAIVEVRKLLYWGCTEIYDVDLSKYFDTVEHGKLMKLLRLRIVDRRVLKIIRMWLRCGYVEGKQHRTPLQGTPQGGVISPLLANLYLNPMDKALEKSQLWRESQGRLTLVRYADDFLLMARRGIKRGQDIVHSILERLGLKINKEKTRELRLGLGDSVEFLGFKFTRDALNRSSKAFYRVTPTGKVLNRIREKVRQNISAQIPKTIQEQIAAINPILRGWTNYFRIGNSSRSFKTLRNFVEQRIRKALQCRKGRDGYNYSKYDPDFIYSKLGLFRDYAVRYA